MDLKLIKHTIKLYFLPDVRTALGEVYILLEGPEVNWYSMRLIQMLN